MPQAYEILNPGQAILAGVGENAGRKMPNSPPLAMVRVVISCKRYFLEIPVKELLLSIVSMNS